MGRLRRLNEVAAGALLAVLLLAQPPNFCCHAKRTIFNIFWNTTNPMFRIDNTDNVIDVNQGNEAWEYDQANIICPVYPVGTREADMERYVIYRVSKEEFENCHLTSPQPRVMAVCNKPHRLMYFTITFRSFTPTPGALEFLPGQDYYFISTSSSSDLHRRIGGRCSTNNMKMVLKIASLESRTKSVNSPRRVEHPPLDVTRRPQVLTERQHYEYLYPEDERVYHEISSNSIDYEGRSEDYESHGAYRQQQQQQASASPESVMLMSKANLILLTFLLTIVRTWTQ